MSEGAKEEVGVSIKLKIGDIHVRVNVDTAKKLYEQLRAIFENGENASEEATEKQTVPIYIPYPVTPNYPQAPYPYEVWWTSSGWWPKWVSGSSDVSADDNDKYVPLN